jgi:hypothetical protein
MHMTRPAKGLCYDSIPNAESARGGRIRILPAEPRRAPPRFFSGGREAGKKPSFAEILCFLMVSHAAFHDLRLSQQRCLYRIQTAWWMLLDASSPVTGSPSSLSTG